MGKNEERVLRWLKQGCTVKEELESVDAMMKMAKSDAAFNLPSGFRVGGNRVQTSPSGEAAFVRALEKNESAMEGLMRKKERLELLKSQLLAAVCSCSDVVGGRILMARYIVGDTWEKIADCMHYSPRQLQRRQEEALKSIDLPPDAVWLR